MTSLPQIRDIRLNARVRGGRYLDPEYVWHVVGSGRWDFRWPGGERRLAPGDVLLLPPGCLHEVAPAGPAGGAHGVVHFLWPDGPLAPGRAAVRTGGRGSPFFVCFEAAKTLWAEGGEWPRLRAAGLVVDLLGASLDGAETIEDRPDWADPRVRRALDLICRRHTDPGFGLGEAAKVAGLSYGAFTRLFHRATGYAPKEHLLRQRIETARALLWEKTLTAAEVAQRSGFASPQVFSRTFRRREGLPPVAWAQSLKARA